MKQKCDRKYLGVTVTSENYRKILEGPGSRNELRFHAKHLRAYLKGRDSFIHGWVTNEGGEKVKPKEHPVLQEITLNGVPSFSTQEHLNSYLRSKNAK